MSTYGGLTAEARAAARRERLLAAGLELLGGEGYAATTVRSVCARARLTPRYFYESFADLDALLVAVFDAVAAEAAEVVVAAADHAAGPAGAAVAGVDPSTDARARARSAIGAFVTLVDEDRRKARVLFAEALGSAPLVRRRADTLRLFAGIVAAQGREFYGVPPGAEALLQTTALTLAGGLAETLRAWLDGTLQVGATELVDDCAELFVATGEAAVTLARGRS